MIVSTPQEFWAWLNSLGPVPSGLMWLAAIGSAVGIPALLFSLWQLWQKDRNQQIELDQLRRNTALLSELVKDIHLIRRPLFILVSQDYSPEESIFTLKNIGGHAKTCGFMHKTGHEPIGPHEPYGVLRDQEVIFRVKFAPPDDSESETEFEAELVFTCELNRRFSQKLLKVKDTNLRVEPPL